MIDTVKLQSPPLSEEVAEAIESTSVYRSALDRDTGEEVYGLTTKSLKGTWDSSVSLRVEREEFVTGPKGLRLITEEVVTGRKGRTSVVKVPCAPYLMIESSVHKALLGHNVYGGPLDPVAASLWFVDYVSSLLGVEVPCGRFWTVQRIDWAEVFELPSFEACEEYISGLNMAQFPRRKRMTYGNETLFFPGSTTALKVYHKGPEFFKHDRKRLALAVGDVRLGSLQDVANCILRFETEVKARKLLADFGHKPLTVELTRDYLEGVHDREASRLLKEAKTDMEIVRTHREVSARLHETYDARLANTLFGTWLQLAALGERETRKNMTRPTWYRQRQQLTEAGVSWQGADVHVCTRVSAIPAGFSPLRSDPRRLTIEAPEVEEQLRPYALAA